jgi:hypothetical protein
MVYFTDTALAANIITPYEADEIEDWIDSVVSNQQVFTHEPPKHIKPLWDRVCLFRCGGSIQ